jgi:hypothetical protein|tara:strand:- start:253 stop:369 length:117 start_codon:yes stop_codon:yes gene_type:complete
MKDKIQRLQEIVEFGMYNINPSKKEAIEIIKELKTKIN